MIFPTGQYKIINSWYATMDDPEIANFTAIAVVKNIRKNSKIQYLMKATHF